MEKVLKRIMAPLLIVAGIIALDQWTKILTLKYVKDTLGFYIIDKVLRIFFVKNQGMAWGALQNKQVLFIVITPIVVAAIIYIYYKIPFEKKYILMRISLLFLTGGAIGNLIDRLGFFRADCEPFHGYVVDMIYVEIINFPVFNVADSFITVGFAMLIVLIMFVYKEKDFDMIFPAFMKREEVEEGETSEETKAEETTAEAEVTEEVKADETTAETAGTKEVKADEAAAAEVTEEVKEAEEAEATE